MEICNTGAKKPTPGLVKFYVVLAGPDLITDVNKATNCLFNVKNPLIYSNFTKTEGLSENMVSNGKTFCRLQAKKKQKQYSRLLKKRQGIPGP